jgi:cell division protein FtsI/penicillin-binding protein 2
MRSDRLFKVILVLLAVLAVLIGRMVQLQVVEHDVWAERARRSRLEKRTLPAERGRILDRDGKVLAQDRRSFDLYFEYRDFRRGQLVGQLFEAFQLMTEPCPGLAYCLTDAERLGARVMQWTPLDLAGLKSRSRGDVQYYLRKIGGLRSDQREPLEQWAVSGTNQAFGNAFPEAWENFKLELASTRYRLQVLQNEIGDRLKLPLLEQLEVERQKLELRIRQQAVRIAAANALEVDPWEVRQLFTGATNGQPALQVDRYFALEQLARRWQWDSDLNELERILLSRPGQSASVYDLGMLLGRVEQLLPEDLAGVRRDLTARVHRDRVVRLVRGVDFEVVDLLGLDPRGYQGLYIQTTSDRVYTSELAPQLVGNVRIAAEGDLEEYLDKKAQLVELGRLLFRTPEQEKTYRGLRDEFLRVLMRPGETRGLNGVEASFENILRGERGFLRLLAGGEEEGQPQELEFVPPSNGQDVQISLSMPLLEAAERSIVAGYREALDTLPAKNAHARPYLREPRVGFAIMDLEDGTVPLLATWPTYRRSELRDQLDVLQDDRTNNVFRNRALGGGFLGSQAPYPGSTFKLLVAIEALAHDPAAWNRTVFCENVYMPRGLRPGPRVQPLKCNNHAAGEMNMHDAIMRSCNTYFYVLATEMGWDRLWRRSQQLGFGSPTGIELVSVEPREIEKTEGDWDDGSRYAATGPNRLLEHNANFLRSKHDEFHAFTMAHFGIGQVSVQASPLQMARFYGWLATGRLLTPRMVLASAGGAPAVPPEPDVPLDPGIQRLVMDAMRAVTEHPKGTAYNVKYPLEQFKVAGKTGTAQTGRSTPNHGWFVGYFPWDKPRYSFAIMCENVELHGGEIANLILYRFLESQEARAFFDPTGN